MKFVSSFAIYEIVSFHFNQTKSFQWQKYSSKANHSKYKKHQEGESEARQNSSWSIEQKREHKAKHCGIFMRLGQ